MQPTANLRRIFLTFVAVFAAPVLACAATLRETPTSAETLNTALADAKRLAARSSEFQVVRVEGKSMQPYFGDGAVLVVKAIAPAKLTRGMVVVYKNRLGETVAHRLVTAGVSGWVAQGYNNNAVDSTPVNEANLIGVVYATLHSSGQVDAGYDLASAVQGTTVALAAPAK